MDTWLGGFFSDIFSANWNGIVEFFADIPEKINSFFGRIWDGIKKIYEPVKEWFEEHFGDVWVSIAGIFGGAVEYFEKIWAGIKNTFSVVGKWFGKKFQSAWQAVKNVFSKGGEIFTGITDGIFNTFKTVVNGLIDGMNWVIEQPFNTINWALDGIRGIEILDWYPFEWLPSITIPEIPKLAQGTVVSANYGEFMAILGDNKHETEVVSPISTIEKAVLNAMQKSNGNFPKEIIVNTYLYPNSTYFHREVVKIVNDDSRNRGR